MALQEQQAAALGEMWEKLHAETRDRLEKQVHETMEANEFLRARMQDRKLTSESPDWLNTRRELLGKTA